MSECAGERHVDGGVGGAAILDGERVHRAGDVGVAPVRRKDGSAQHELTDGARERWNPPQRALPRHRNFRQLVAYTADVQDRPRQRVAGARDEITRSGELDRRTGGAVQHAQRMNGCVDRVDARQRNPVVSGDLPGDGRRRERSHDGVYIPGDITVE
jgi:hypothetical protein